VAIAAGRLDRALDSFLAGECGKAKREARGSLAVVGQRVAPYEVIAFCDMQEGRYRAASAAVRRALERDPRNWELHYGLAIARASAGQDPRRHAASAAALNPQDPRAAGAPALFAGTNRRSWALAGREAELLPPSRGDP
jgi:Tfp pilus assembly protein PilF